jgi:inner membrane protein
MDLLTQAALGGAVGELTLGKRVGNRALLWGSLGGILPDGDYLLRWTHGELTYWIEQNGLTHSLLFALLVPWLLGAGVKWLERKRFPDLRRRQWGKLFFWVFLTHLALDGCTTGGVQLFYPFWHYRVSLSFISVIDPLYTLPLLTGLLVGLRHAPNTRLRNMWMGAGMVVSSLYLLFAFTNQQFVRAIFANVWRQGGRQVIRFETYPTLGNTLLWYGVAEEAYGYHIAYYSLLAGREGGLSTVYLPKQHGLADSLVNPRLEDRLQEASHRYYNLEKRGDAVLWHDLQYGLANVAEPQLYPTHYTLSYVLTYDQPGRPRVDPARAWWERDTAAWKRFGWHIWGGGWP